MKRALLTLLLGMLVAIFFLTQGVLAQPAPAQVGAAGHWEGEITLPGTALEIHVDLSRDKDAWEAKIDIPQQGAQGLALQSVRVEAEKVHFELQAGPGLAVFEGKLEGDKISGTFTQAGQAFPFSLTRKAAAAAATQTSAAGKQGLDGLDDFVARAMKDWKVPGLAIAVVQDGKVILSKGYGYRDMEKQLPVTSNTLFAIGSITKSFTVSTLGMEMDEGKVDWDKPVRDYLPTFKLYEPMLTEQVMIRDLVTHRTGLPRHDFVWYTSDFSREDLLRRLQYLEPSKPLRAKFQYNNLMFMTAGYIAGQLNGTSWEDAITQRVLRPLGMNGTNFSELDTQNSSDFAQPYRKGSDLKAELKRIPFDQQCPTRCARGPAGEINSNVDDMSKYLLFHMNKGKVGGKQLLSENNSVQMQVPQMAIQGASPYKELGDDNYGMGFFLSTYRGHKVVEHGGNIDGFSAELTFMPNEKIGVVVLTNLDGNPLTQILAWNIYDRLLGLDQVGWSQRMLAQEAGGKKSEQEAKDKGYTERKTGTHPSHELKE
ncbi:MAG: serine hydrolase, partial [Mycobacterium sp.]